MIIDEFCLALFFYLINSMASNPPEIGSLVQHLCDIVSSQATEILSLQSTMNDLSTESMDAIKELEAITRKERQEMNQRVFELEKMIKSLTNGKADSSIELSVDKMIQPVIHSQQILANKHQQLSLNVNELVDCFERSLIIDEEGNNGNQVRRVDEILAEQKTEISKIYKKYEIMSLQLNESISDKSFAVQEIQDHCVSINSELDLIKHQIIKIGGIGESDYQNLNKKVSKIEELIGSRENSSGSLILKVQNVSRLKSSIYLNRQTEIDVQVADKVSYQELEDILKSAVSIEALAEVKLQVSKLVDSLSNKADSKDLGNVCFEIKNLETSIAQKIDQQLFQDLELSIVDKIRLVEDNTKTQLLIFKKNSFSKINSLIDSLKNKQENYVDVCGIVQENVMNEIGQQIYQMSLQVSDIKSMHLKVPVEAIFVWRNCQLLQNCIIWDYETANTAENLIQWRSGEPFILFTEPGIYSISMAFFTTHKPLIKVILNGEKLFTVVNSPTFVIGHDSGYINDNGKVRRGSKCGLSVTEYVRIVKNSKLMIMFQGKTDYIEGFLRVARIQ